MTFKELLEALKELESLGVDIDKKALTANQDGVKSVKTIFTNGLGDLYMDTRGT